MLDVFVVVLLCFVLSSLLCNASDVLCEGRCKIVFKWGFSGSPNMPQEPVLDGPILGSMHPTLGKLVGLTELRVVKGC